MLGKNISREAIDMAKARRPNDFGPRARAVKTKATKLDTLPAPLPKPSNMVWLISVRMRGSRNHRPTVA